MGLSNLGLMSYFGVGLLFVLGVQHLPADAVLLLTFVAIMMLVLLGWCLMWGVLAMPWWLHVYSLHITDQSIALKRRFRKEPLWEGIITPTAPTIYTTSNYTPQETVQVHYRRYYDLGGITLWMSGDPATDMPPPMHGRPHEGRVYRVHYLVDQDWICEVFGTP